ncbi:hypothetical protein LPJ53_004853 [Coemansia erecta]|uniref:Uncharacterized protein n=1 Tax=Coemansia erecta TaxID=147472 RepID=A0A9W8CPD8_9FUNG|nr:hypothetical protein LPJ53_004853 [Coemansia erecta]
MSGYLSDNESTSVVIKRLFSKNNRAKEGCSEPIVFEMPDSMELKTLNELIESTWYISPGYQVFVHMDDDGSITRLDIKSELKTKTLWSRKVIYTYNKKYFEEVKGNLITQPHRDNDDKNESEDERDNEDNFDKDDNLLYPSSLSTTKSDTTFSFASSSFSFSNKSSVPSAQSPL